MKFVPLLWAGIWRRPGRTVLAVVQILLAFSLFGLLQGFSSYTRQAIANIDADLLQVHSRGSFSNLPRADYEQIVQVPGVKLTNFANYFQATYQIPTQQFLVIITDARNWTAMTHDVVIAPTDVERLAHTRTGAIVGDALMRKYGWKVGQRLPVQIGVPQQNGSNNCVRPKYFEVNPELHLTAGRMFQPAVHELIVGKVRYTEDQGLELGERVRLWGSDWTVVGHFESQSASDDAALLTDAETLLSAHQLNQFSRVQVVLDSPGSLAVLDRALKANPTIHIEARSEAEVNREQSKEFTRLLDFVSYFVGAVMAAGATVGAVNAMYVLVDNRRRELATLRAIGFRPGPIVVAVLIESVLMALPGALLGVGIAWILYNGHHVSPFGISFDLTVNGSIVALGVAWAVAMGLLGGILPALRAARVPVTDALRAS